MKVLYILRIVVLGLILIVASKPVRVRPDPGLPASWAVLVDKSASMAVEDATMRLAEAKKIAAEILRRFPRFKLFAFAGDLEERDVDSLASIRPDGSRTEFESAIAAVFKKEPLRGVIFLTDGRQVGPGDAVGLAAALGKPLVMIGLGDKGLFKDVSVRSVQSPPFAFKNVQTSLSAVISAVGYPNHKLTVRLKKGRRVVALQTLRTSGSDVESTVTFNWTPSSLGPHTLTVEVDRYAGEFSNSNNQKTVTIDVGRDRFRVLYICGLPGPEYGFLRQQFKADPAVELVTFVILRGAQNVVNVPDSELSLIPFPTQDVLMNQMSSFDLIVFDEFTYQNYGLLPQVVYAVRKKVEDGGSFLVIGGKEMLGSGSRYAIPGIQEMLPVEFGTPAVQTIPGPLPFIPKVANHPIFRLKQDPKENKAAWSSLPPVEEITLLPGVKKGATAIGVVHYQGKDYPVLTVWPYKKGRVAVLTTRTTWRFSMMGGFAYQQFWKNMVLWLTRADQFKPVRVAFDNRRLRRGTDETIRVWAFDEYFKPLSDVEVRLQIAHPDGSTEDVKTFRESEGVYAGVVKGEIIGTHTARVWVYKNGRRIGSDSIQYFVVEGFSEEEDLRPDFGNLKDLAQASGGRFVTAQEFSVDAFYEFDDRLSEKIGKKVLTWNSPWFLTLIAAFILLELFLRKKGGLP